MSLLLLRRTDTGSKLRSKPVGLLVRWAVAVPRTGNSDEAGPLRIIQSSNLADIDSHSDSNANF